LEFIMRFAALLIALCTIPAIGTAQAADCRSVANSSERLACYDKATPPTAQRAAAPKPGTTGQQAPVGDVLAAENSKLDARIKGICRGC
jgi:hypothetical protein